MGGNVVREGRGMRRRREGGGGWGVDGIGWGQTKTTLEETKRKT